MFKKGIHTKNLRYILLALLFFDMNASFKASINDELKKNISYTKPFSNELINNQYIVDSGDILYLNFKDINIFTGPYSVNLNGEIFLPEIGLFSARGKTIQEAMAKGLEIDSKNVKKKS